MRGKPDLNKLDKDPSAFLEGGAVETTEKQQKRKEKPKGKPKGPEKYTFPCRLTLDVGKVLKENCGGNQSVYIDNLLRKHFKEQGLM